MTEFVNAREAMRDIFGSIDWSDPEVCYYATLDKIAIAINGYRKENHLSQTALAKQLGITQAMVSKYESGDYNFSLKSLFDLLGSLNIHFNIEIGQSAHAEQTPNMKETQEQYNCAPEEKDNLSDEFIQAICFAS